MKLISSRIPNDLPQFLSATYDTYVRDAAGFKLKLVIGTFTNAKLNGSFIELRALQLVSAVDVLVGLWATAHGINEIIDQTLFQLKQVQREESISTVIMQLYGIEAHVANEMAIGSRGLFRQSFRRKLAHLIEKTSAGISNDEIGRFVASRNSLVHNGVFLTKDFSVEWKTIVSFVDRLFLAFLGYRGPYIDCRNWHRVEP
jgi:hypothetical protein